LFMSDSVIFLDKINKTYYKGTYDYFSKYIGLGINYNFIYYILSGLPASIDYTCKPEFRSLFNDSFSDGNYKYSYSMENGDYSIYRNFTYPYINYAFLSTDRGKLLNNNYFDRNKNISLNIDYGYSKKDQIESFEINLKHKTENQHITILIKSIYLFDHSLNFYIPKSYNRIQ